MRCCQIGYFRKLCWDNKFDAAARSNFFKKTIMQVKGEVAFEPRIVLTRVLAPMKELELGSTYSSLGECNSVFLGSDSLRHWTWTTWWIYRSNGEFRTGTHVMDRLEEKGVRAEALEWFDKSSRRRQDHAESWIIHPLTASRTDLQTIWAGSTAPRTLLMDAHCAAWWRGVHKNTVEAFVWI